MKKTLFYSLDIFRAFSSVLLIFLIGADFVNGQETFRGLHQQYIVGEKSRLETIDAMIHFLNNDEHLHDGDFSKCLTPLMILLEQENEILEISTLKKLNQSATEIRALPEEYLSESGKFRIHYEIDGIHSVPLDDLNSNGIPDYVEEVAEAADSSYRHEILTLGFTDPIGTGEIYDVFVENLEPFGAYGLTNNRTSGGFACNSSSPRTCIYIENDFLRFPPNTDPEGDMIGSIKVTMAHEFKHAIQFAQNQWRGDSDRWAEMDATLMEEVVYDNVNDYYNYITGFASDLFNSPATTLSAGSYEDITWALYFHEKFGQNFWPEVWENIEANLEIPLVEAIEVELIERGEQYDFTVLESYMWHYASGSDFSGTNFGFGERLNYPNPALSDTVVNLQTELTDSRILNPFAARYYLIDIPNSTNGFLKLNYESGSEDVHYGLIGYLMDGSIETLTATGNAERLMGTIESNWSWSDLDKVGLVVMNNNTSNTGTYAFQFDEYSISQEIQLAQNFPNPFNPKTKIRIAFPEDQDIKLEVYDLLGRLVHTIYEGPVLAGFRDFQFNADALASGVYIYKVEGASGVKTKAMTLIK